MFLKVKFMRQEWTLRMVVVDFMAGFTLEDVWVIDFMG